MGRKRKAAKRLLKIPVDYRIIFFICVAFTVMAFVLESPALVLEGYVIINNSRSVLVSDYVAMAGVSATLLNSAINGFFFLVLLVLNKCKPNGKIIAALFLTIGFSLFGKNMFNTLPICAGVALYAKAKGVKFSAVLISAMFGGTVSPIVSEIAFLHETATALSVISSYMVGMFIGFIFPLVTEAVKRMHRGYCLYNSGIAGGFIATFFVGIFRSVGIEVLPESFWDTSNTEFLAAIAFTLAVSMIVYGIITEKPVNAFKKFRQLTDDTDMRDNDYYTKYGNSCYINIGIMCIISTAVVLFLKIPINGPVLGGILTVAGFGAAGKHIKNSIPVLFGSIVGANLNHIELNASVNSLAILFSTGLAPISSKHGWFCGIVAGFLHVTVAIIIGNLNGGLNLYNNGFAGGFVAITVVPLIVLFKEILFGYKGDELT